MPGKAWQEVVSSPYQIKPEMIVGFEGWASTGYWATFDMYEVY
jgi:hypothetical protein